MCIYDEKQAEEKIQSEKEGKYEQSSYYIVIIFLTSWLQSRKGTGCNQEKVNVSTPNDEQVPVSGSIVVNDKEYEMRVGEYEWNGDDGAHITKTDSYSPKEVAKEFDDLTLEKDTRVQIPLKNNPKLTVYQLNQNNQKEKVTIKNNRIEVSSKSGYYLYEVSGKWPHGKATYLFDVNVK
ncbi:hypothetical protein [Priestia megaterium]|uniref:hypothetical protein n=1 Tax=Priestia megaterium TaxID=1404 RepID=UPI0020D21CC8|nr:hypothetical protein [Priestia megaterium]